MLTRSLRDITTNTCTGARALIKPILTLTCLYNRDAGRRADGCSLTAPQYKCLHVLHYVDPAVTERIHRNTSDRDDIIDHTSPGSSPQLKTATPNMRLELLNGQCFAFVFGAFVLTVAKETRQNPSFLLPVLISVVPFLSPVSEPVRVLASVPLWYRSEWIHGEEHQEELPGNAPVHGEIPSDWSPGRSR